MSISIVRLFGSMWLVTVPGPLTGFKIIVPKNVLKEILQNSYQKGEWTIWQYLENYPSEQNVTV